MYRISKYHIGQQDAENLMKTVSLQRKGLMLVTLTNFDNTLAPAIARGSICDVANTLYESAGETILGTARNGQNYIKLVPTSDDNIAAYYTQTDPVWSAELGGWYGVGDSANHRYIASFRLSSDQKYRDKKYLYNPDSNRVKRKYNTTLPTNSIFVLHFDSFIVTRTSGVIPEFYFYPDGGATQEMYIQSRGALFPEGKYKIIDNTSGLVSNMNIDILATVPENYTLDDVVTVI